MTDVVAALIWEGERFLACQRPKHKARGLLWEFVGGKVEPGESKEAALIRECREELDVTVEPRQVFMEVIHEYPDLTVRLTLFHAAIVEGTPKLLEHNALRWITVKEIDQLPFCPADEEILERLKAGCPFPGGAPEPPTWAVEAVIAQPPVLAPWSFVNRVCIKPKKKSLESS